MTINYSAWDLLDEFSVFDAACLWLEIEPTCELRGAKPPKIEAAMKAIEKHTDAYRGDSVYIGPPSDTQIMLDAYMGRQTRVHVNRYPENATRTALVQMANDKGVKPKFLFPEMRTESAEGTTDKPVNSKKRNSYLKLIKGLLEKLNIDPSERGVSKQLEKIGSLSNDAILDILKEVQDLVD
jgi:hypothetical protein